MAATVLGMRPITLAVALLLLTVAGCTVQRSGAPAPGPTTTTTTTSSTTTTTTVTTTTTEPPTVAADGTNLQACRDAVCEVAIKVSDVIPVDSLGALPVAGIDGTSVTLVMPGGAIMTFDGELTINDTIVVTNLRTDPTGAIVRIRPV